MKTKSNRRGRRQRGYRGLLWVLAAGLLVFLGAELEKWLLRVTGLARRLRLG